MKHQLWKVDTDQLQEQRKKKKFKNQLKCFIETKSKFRNLVQRKNWKGLNSTIQNTEIKYNIQNSQIKPLTYKIIQWNIENHNQTSFMIKQNTYDQIPKYKIIQWNCCGYKANYNELLLLTAELNPITLCPQETEKKKKKKKAVTNQIWKTKNNMITYASFRWSSNPN